MIFYSKVVSKKFLATISRIFSFIQIILYRLYVFSIYKKEKLIKISIRHSLFDVHNNELLKIQDNFLCNNQFFQSFVTT